MSAPGEEIVGEGDSCPPKITKKRGRPSVFAECARELVEQWGCEKFDVVFLAEAARAATGEPGGSPAVPGVELAVRRVRCLLAYWQRIGFVTRRNKAGTGLLERGYWRGTGRKEVKSLECKVQSGRIEQ